MSRPRPRTPAARLWFSVHHLAIVLVLCAGVFLCFSSVREIVEHRFTDRSGGWTIAGVSGLLVVGLALFHRVYLWKSRRWVSSRLSDFRSLVILMFCVWSALVWLVPYHIGRIQLGIGIGITLWSLLLTFERSIADWSDSRVMKISLWVAVQVCLLVVGLEIGLRVVAHVTPSPLLLRTNSGVIETLETSRRPPGMVIYGFPVNEGGHYDESFADPVEQKHRVLAIGDSFSASIVPHYFHFTTVAERELQDTRIENMGHPSIGPAEYLFLLQTEGLPLEPDLVVINVFVGNDVRGSKRIQGPGFMRSWFDRENLLLSLVPQRLGRIIEANPVQAAELLQNGRGPSPGRLLLEPAEIVQAFPWLDDALLERPHFSDEAYLDVEVGRARRVLRPALRHHFATLFDSLAQIRRAAGDIPMVIMLIPDEFQVNDDLWSRVVAHFPGVDLERDLPQELITPWLEDEGIPYLDLLPVLRGADPCEDGKLHVYHVNDSHFNRRGNDVTGKALAEFLRPLLK